MLDLYKTLKPRDAIIKEKLEETWSKLESDYLTNPLETIKHLILNDYQIVDNDEDFASYFEEIKAKKLNDTIVNHVVFNLKKGIGYIPLNFQFHYDQTSYTLNTIVEAINDPMEYGELIKVTATISIKMV